MSSATPGGQPRAARSLGAGGWSSPSTSFRRRRCGSRGGARALRSDRGRREARTRAASRDGSRSRDGLSNGPRCGRPLRVRRHLALEPSVDAAALLAETFLECVVVPSSSPPPSRRCARRRTSASSRRATRIRNAVSLTPARLGRPRGAERRRDRPPEATNGKGRDEARPGGARRARVRVACNVVERDRAREGAAHGRRRRRSDEPRRLRQIACEKAGDESGSVLARRRVLPVPDGIRRPPRASPPSRSRAAA